MIEPREADIDGLHVKITPLPGRRAYRLLRRLLSALGPSLAEVLGKAGGDLGAVELDGLAGAVASLMDRLTEVELDGILDTLLEQCVLSGDGKEGLYRQVADELFAGRLLTLGKVVAFALQTNYSDFSAAAQGALAAVRTTAPAAKGS